MGWQLEVAKMFMYITFPVAIFHYFNQPKNFEEWVIETKKKHFPPESKHLQEEMENFIHEFNAAARIRHLEEMEKQHKMIK